MAARASWDAQHGWRETRMAEIDTTLAHHRADVTLRSVRADDPLAFGVDRLRHARRTYRDDLQRLDDIRHALNDTRPQRVVAAGDDPTSELSVLGPRPANTAGRDTWSAIVERIETLRDQTLGVDSVLARRRRSTHRAHVLGPRPDCDTRVWDHLADLIDRSDRLIAHAVDSIAVPEAQTPEDPARWQTVLELVERAIRVETPQRHLERDYGIEL